MTWSAVALGGAVATLLATLLHSDYLGTSHLTRCLLFLLATLALTSGHTSTSLSSSSHMFDDRVRGESRKYLASQTFTANYPPLDKSKWADSIACWLLVFLCKFVESYFYLTLSFNYLIQVMVGTKIQGCTDQLFSNALCTNHPFTLTIMFVLFSLDTSTLADRFY